MSKISVFLNRTMELLHKGKDCFSLDSLPSQVIKTYKQIAKCFSWDINTDIEDNTSLNSYHITRLEPKEEMSSGVSNLIYK